MNQYNNEMGFWWFRMLESLESFRNPQDESTYSVLPQ